MALDDKLILEMSKIAGMYDVVSNYETDSLAEKAASLGPFTQLAAESEDHLADIALELENSDDVARYKKMAGFLNGRLARNESDYKANVKEITEDVVERFNGDLEKAKNPLEAAMSIAYAFVQLEAQKDLTPEEANRAKAVELSQLYGVNFTHVKDADVKEYSQKDYSLAVRRKATEYIVEVDVGDKKEYRIDEAKVKELVADPMIGSVLYSAEKPKKGD
jgi:hypothetical protein